MRIVTGHERNRCSLLQQNKLIDGLDWKFGGSLFYI